MCEILTEVVLNLKTEAINSEEIFLQERDWPKVMGREDCSEWSLEVRISLWNY